MKKALLATTAIVAMAMLGGANAADLSRPMMKAPPPIAPACAQFGGFYVGGHVGWGYYDSDWKSQDSWLEQTDDDFPSSSRRSKSGFIGGVQGGYNWQAGCTVFGVEVDYGWSRITADEFYTADPPPNVDTALISSRLNGLGTVRARTGVVVNNLLLYVTGGFAYADFDRSWTLTRAAPFATETFAYSRWRWGWTAGFGTEWAAWGNWSIKSEVLYARFERDDQNFVSAFSQANQLHRFRSDDSIWTTRIGLNYRFGPAR